MLQHISSSCLPKQGSRSLSSLLPLTPALCLRASMSQQGTCGLMSHKGMQLGTSMPLRMGGIYRSLSICRLRHCSMGSSSFCQKFSMDNSIRLCWPNNVTSTGSSRFYSQVHTPTYKSEDVSPRAAMEGANAFKGFKNNRKKKKNAIAAQSRKSTVSKTEPEREADGGAESPATSKTEYKSGDLDTASPASRVKKEGKAKKRKELQESKNSKEKTSVKSISSKASKSATQAESSAMAIEDMPAEASTVGQSSINDSSSQKKKSSTRTKNSKRKGKSPKTVSEPFSKGEDLEVSKIGYSGDKILKKLYPPMGKSVVVVESLTKAKVIQGYLGDQFEVLPSYGHVRDLAARSGSVRPDDDFSMVWEVPSSAWTHLKSIRVALTRADNLVLASDPDREGEAIAWHIIEMLRQQDALRDDVTVARVVFHEITESAVKTALQAPRDIDVNLVHAYLARRALDYLIGFNISPLLWRKLPGCQSAGRVQSAALSLICDREKEIEEFVPKEYWSVEVEFNQGRAASDATCSFPSHLTYYALKKLNQLSISSRAEAEDIEKNIKLDVFKVTESKSNRIKRNPPTPYITSTLQQDAANKLHFPASYTMKLAQKLYEGVQLSDKRAVGLITYIRTDGLHISDEAVKDIRSLVIERFGPEYALETPRKYFKRVKNAQEAHEAVRPTDICRLPSMLSGVIDDDSLKLYALIWSRTMACQMEQSVVDQIHVNIGNADRSIAFSASSSRISFPGYLAAFKDIEAKAVRNKENNGKDRDDAFAIISTIEVGDVLSLDAVELKQHFTQPPPRYSEGSLVKKLEELGIGRPSTYASTLKVLQDIDLCKPLFARFDVSTAIPDRNYVTVKSRMLHPEFRGRMVSAFLANHFSEVTDYSFTADMESELDNVSAGITEWKGLLKDYWTRFSSYCDRAATVHIHQVEKMLEKTFGDFLFSSLPDKSRTCPSCLEGTLIFKVSRFGAGYFIGCNQHPKCKYIAKTLYGDDEEEGTPRNSNTVEEPKLLGHHPTSNEKILLKSGPYGAYVQLGEDRKGYVPKRASISQTKDLGAITLEDALELLQYPLTLGDHPKDGQPVVLKLAKVGFTIRHRRTIASVPKNLKPQDITLDKALQLLSGKDVRQCGRPKAKPKVEEALEVM